jgi:RNA polymerase sigma-70 factor, ECF subfamily
LKASRANTDEHTQNVKAAASVFDKYEDFIYTIICYKVKDKAQADDLFQDFFLSLVSNPLPSDDRNVKGYLYRAIMNDIFDNVRRTERYQAQLQRYSKHLRYSSAEENPENALIKTEEIDSILSVIEKQLQNSESHAVTLRYVKDYKIKDIAAEMSVNNTAAWRYIAEGLKKIRFFLRVG